MPRIVVRNRLGTSTLLAKEPPTRTSMNRRLRRRRVYLPVGWRAVESREPHRRKVLAYVVVALLWLATTLCTVGLTVFLAEAESWRLTYEFEPSFRSRPLEAVSVVVAAWLGGATPVLINVGCLVSVSVPAGACLTVLGRAVASTEPRHSESQGS